MNPNDFLLNHNLCFRLEWREYNCEVSPRRVRSLLNTVFGDNFGIPLTAFPDEKKAKSSKSILTIKGPADCLVYCGKFYQLACVQTCRQGTF